MTVKRLLNVVKRVLAPRDGPLILMYHRIGAPLCDPAYLAVTAENLAAQIEVLKHHRNIVPLGWLTKRRELGLSVSGTAVVTFDDGYADVLHNGLPVLARLDCPATVFLATGTTGTISNMWWDIVGRLFFTTTTLPDEITLTLAGGPCRIAIAAADPRSKARAYHMVCETIRPLPSVARDAIVESLSQQIRGGREDLEADRMMTPDEVLRWYRKDVFEIGGHTVTHPSLPALSAAEQFGEIEESCRRCAALIGEAVVTFAYPYGHYASGTLAAVRRAGLSAAVTTEKRRISPKDNPLALPRYFVGNWGEAEFERALAL